MLVKKEPAVVEDEEDLQMIQGNPTAVVRILRELKDQKQFMQNGLVLLAK
jgi:sensor domain CHASE-containing protein